MYPVKVLHSDLDNILATFSVVPLFLLDGLVVAENVCSPICSMEYNPVCAGDGVSKPVVFGNPCEFENYNCVNPDKRKFHKHCDFLLQPSFFFSYIIQNQRHTLGL
jgi:hypothetical protein